MLLIFVYILIPIASLKTVVGFSGFVANLELLCGGGWPTGLCGAVLEEGHTPGIIAGMVAGFVVCVGWKLAYVPFGLGSAVPGAIACGIALVVVSLLTCKKHPSVYLKVHKELPPEASAE